MIANREVVIDCTEVWEAETEVVTVLVLVEDVASYSAVVTELAAAAGEPASCSEEGAQEGIGAGA